MKTLLATIALAFTAGVLYGCGPATPLQASETATGSQSFYCAQHSNESRCMNP